MTKKLFFLCAVAGLLAFQQNLKAGSGQVDIVVVAEQETTAPEPSPTPSSGATYTVFDAGYSEYGNTIAGEKNPAAPYLAQVLKESLATQGFQTSVDPAPSLLLIYHWGILAADTQQLKVPYKIKPNLRARIELVGTKKMAGSIENYLLNRMNAPGIKSEFPIPMRLNGSLETAFDLAKGRRYFVVVSAYDFASVANKEPKLVWRTKASAQDNQGWSYQVIPALIRGAAPSFGKTLSDVQDLKIDVAAADTASPNSSAENLTAPLPDTGGQIDPAFIRTLIDREKNELFVSPFSGK